MPLPLKSGDYVAFHSTFSFIELLLYYSDYINILVGGTIQGRALLV
mgnify:CR=1 FL=1